MSLSKLQEIVKDREAWCAAVHGVAELNDLLTEQQQRGHLKTWGERGQWAGGSLKREGACVYLWLIRLVVWQKATQYCNYPSVKND